MIEALAAPAPPNIARANIEMIRVFTIDSQSWHGSQSDTGDARERVDVHLKGEFAA